MIRDVARQVETAFPFQDYLEEGFAYGLSGVVSEVTRLAPPPARLLDIGAGPMNVTAVFARLGYACSAVDDLLDPWHRRDDNVDRIKEFAESEGIEFHRHQPPDYEIPFPEEAFDVVLLNSVVEHLHQSPRQLLNSAFEHANSGGMVVVTTPNSVNLRKRLDVLRGRTNYPPVDQFFHSDQWRGHVREYTLAEARYVLEQAGGTVEVARTYDNSLVLSRLPNRIVRWGYVRLTDLLQGLRPALLVIARKPEGWRPVPFDEQAHRAATAASLPRGVS